MRRISRRLIFMSILGSALLSCGGSTQKEIPPSLPAQPTPPATNSPSSISDIADQAAQSVDGIIIYVDTAAQQPLSVSAGISDRSTQTPMLVQQLFKIASISKLFIAVAVAKLVNEGAFLPTDTLSMWLPELSGRIENAEIITIDNLLQHTSGIPDFDSQPGFTWQHSHTDVDSTLFYALNKPADFAPDARYEYSNSNYLLLAKIMDRALGYAHQQYIKDNILKPLQMTKTYLQLSDIRLEELTSGYWENIDRKNQDYAIPGGSMISTAKDIAVFIRALNTGTLLSPEEMRLYRYWFSHSGWLPGYQSVANYYPDIDTVVVQFINTTGDGSENIASLAVNQTLSILRRPQ